MNDFIIVEWSGGKRKLYKATCSTCGADRGYKKPALVKGNCKSCQKKKDCGTLGIIKKCISCQSTDVPDPSKHWFAGPTCYRCYGKIYRKDNKEAIRTRIDKWREVNKEQHRALEIKWRQDNKGRKDASDRAWRANNLEHVRKSSRERQKKKEATDLSFKIARRLRGRFNKFIKNKDAESYEVLAKYITYTYDEATKHIESLFAPGMTWSNYGVNGWHIDHIRPLCSFDLTVKNEIIEAWKLYNLRPLWCVDNWKKSKQDKLCKKKN